VEHALVVGGVAKEADGDFVAALSWIALAMPAASGKGPPTSA